MKFQYLGKKSLLLVLFVLLCRLTVMAQQSHFIYIQSDNKQPFFILHNKKNYSSSNTGYLIISKIPAGEQSLTLGFTGSKQPALDFTLVVDGDAGYALKNLEEKGWGLYNLQTMAVTMGAVSLKNILPPAVPAVKKPEVTATTTAPAKPAANNQFGDMLAQAVDDPELVKNNKPQVQTPEKKPAVKPAEQKQPKPVDTVAVEEEDIAASAATRGVIKAGENQGDKGTDMVFIDFNNKGSDTVKIFIPVALPAADSAKTAEAQPAEKKEQPVVAVDTVVTPKEEGAVNNPFYTPPAGASVAANKEVDVKQPAKDTLTINDNLPEKKIASYNSNCTGGMATDKDLDKLKKRMVGEGAEDKMIAAAKKAFKQKCYTTEQIKSLGMLFFTDESRYSFYDASYPFVYDVANFSSLETMLLEDYYKKRFRAMLRS